jgi:hypothetical protein
MAAKRFIIEADGVKRELPVPFAICASPTDLEWLARKLNEAALLMQNEGASYGWTSVYEDLPALADTPPLPWGRS